MKIKQAKVLYYPNVKEDKFGQFIEQLEEQEEINTDIQSFQLPASLLEYYNQLQQLESIHWFGSFSVWKSNRHFKKQHKKNALSRCERAFFLCCFIYLAEANFTKSS